MNNLIAFFAHPDDESFGPGGTLALLAKSHNVHIIFATKGEACTINRQLSPAELQELRMIEARTAADIIGAKTVSFLDFPDGFIGNEHIQKMTSILEREIYQKQANTLITFEPRGFSGHLDHIAVTTAVTSSFNRLSQIESVYYFGITDHQRALLPSYFIPIPPGYSRKAFDMVVDVSSVWETKKEAIAQYGSQQEDIAFWDAMLEGYHKHEHFITISRGQPTLTEHILQVQ